MSLFQLQPIAKAALQLLGVALGIYALFLIQGVVAYALIALYISVLGRPLFKLKGRVGNGQWKGVKEEMIPAMAKEAAQQWTANFNPRPITANDFENLYRSTYQAR